MTEDAPWIIPADIRIEGKLRSQRNIVLYGSMLADVETQGSLVIKPNAELRGSVVAKVLHVQGTLIGPASCTQSIAVESGGLARGNLRAPDILVAPTGTVEGQLEMRMPDGVAATSSRRMVHMKTPVKLPMLPKFE